MNIIIRFGNLLFASLIFALCLGSCDRVDNPLPAKKPASVIDTAGLDQLVGSAFIKKVLLEDYTGHTCGNCPQAAIIASNMKKKYGNSLVVMAVHASAFADPKQDTLYDLDLRTTEGTTYDATFDVGNQGLPQGLVNRTTPSGQAGVVIGRSLWEAAIIEQLSKAPSVGIKMGAIYKPDSRLVNLKVQSQILSNTTTPLNLVVYVIEDSLVGYQTDYSIRGGDHNVRGYVFNHVLRQSINGVWGYPLTTAAALASATPINRYFGFYLPKTYRANHCKLIAAITETQSHKVIQVEEVDLPRE